MTRNRKNKIRTIDGKALYLAPGLYELHQPIPNIHVPKGYWDAGTRFVIVRHINKIGDQMAYEHYSISVAGNKKYLIDSYQTEKWNFLATKLIPVQDNLEEFVAHGEIPPLYVLDQLEQSGVISRDDIWNAIEERQRLVQ